jgi:hypothetical protein
MKGAVLLLVDYPVFLTYKQPHTAPGHHPLPLQWLDFQIKKNRRGKIKFR